jgi:hypothetical protein
VEEHKHVVKPRALVHASTSKHLGQRYRRRSQVRSWCVRTGRFRGHARCVCFWEPPSQGPQRHAAGTSNWPNAIRGDSTACWAPEMDRRMSLSPACSSYPCPCEAQFGTCPTKTSKVTGPHADEPHHGHESPVTGTHQTSMWRRACCVGCTAIRIHRRPTSSLIQPVNGSPLPSPQHRRFHRNEEHNKRGGRSLLLPGPWFKSSRCTNLPTLHNAARHILWQEFSMGRGHERHNI